MNRILIFETDPREAIHLSQYLQAGGFAVATVTTARQAISFAREYEFDIFVVNLRTPGETGFTTIAEIKCRPQTAHVQVIGLVPAPTMRLSAEEAGCDAVLIGTADGGQVMRTATELLERSHNSITYMKPMDATANSTEQSFDSLSQALCTGIAWLEPRLPELGEQGPIAIESMRDASGTLRQRLDPQVIIPGGILPSSVCDRQIRHDFRNLLAAVTGFAEILLLEDNLPQDIQEQLRSLKHDSRVFCNMLDSIKESAA